METAFYIINTLLSLFGNNEVVSKMLGDLQEYIHGFQHDLDDLREEYNELLKKTEKDRVPKDLDCKKSSIFNLYIKGYITDGARCDIKYYMIWELNFSRARTCELMEGCLQSIAAFGEGIIFRSSDIKKVEAFKERLDSLEVLSYIQ